MRPDAVLSTTSHKVEPLKHPGSYCHLNSTRFHPYAPFYLASLWQKFSFLSCTWTERLNDTIWEVVSGAKPAPWITIMSVRLWINSFFYLVQQNRRFLSVEKESLTISKAVGCPITYTQMRQSACMCMPTHTRTHTHMCLCVQKKNYLNIETLKKNLLITVQLKRLTSQ